ncbi:hypothetical protein, partial [Nostoc sp. UHCC 0251]|uniref:hypothetical protein n=1 Tax=Nostoc sp. UHCC 0251 TaxID=3110240 RepID=UPI002B213E3B
FNRLCIYIMQLKCRLAYQQFAELMQMLTDEAKDGPRLFSFKPIEAGFFDRPKWISAKFQLTLWCEHARQPLPALNPNHKKKGVYRNFL